MGQEEIFINGDLLRLRREASGWVLNDLATRACMSVKQIRQLEEGGLSAYYSQAVKITAAKKVGALLGLSAEEVLTSPSELSQGEIQIDEPAPASNLDAVQTINLPCTLEESAQDPLVSDQVQAYALSVDVEPKKTKTSLWLIAGLFVSALLVAAYMQPQDELPSEAAPPLQTLPADVTDAASAASAASAAEVSASSAEVLVLPASAASVSVNVQKPASSSASISSAPRAAVQVSSGASPVMVRPASAIIVSPAAYAASKAP